MLLGQVKIPKDASVYVPYIGDGDIAAELYSEYRIFGADLDAQRVKTAQSRLEGAQVRVADCDRWPFPYQDAVFTVGDFDAYAYPYDSFRAFWNHANKADEMVLFFTDAQKMAAARSGSIRMPTGERHKFESTNERRKMINFYFKRYLLPWLPEAVAPYEVVTTKKYLRGMMIYWGAVIRKPKDGPKNRRGGGM